MRKKLLMLFFCSFISLGNVVCSKKTTKQGTTDLLVQKIRKKEKRKTAITLFLAGSIGMIVSLGALFHWRRYYFYLPTDLNKCVRGFFLYKIEQKGSGIISYLHGGVHTRSAQYVVPKIIQDLSPCIDRLVTETNPNEDEDLKVLRGIFFNEILEKYSKCRYDLLRPYIEEIEAYKKADELQFLYSGGPWLTMKYDGKGRYTEKEFYDFFKSKEKGGLETMRKQWALLKRDQSKDARKSAKKKASDLWDELEKYALDSDKRQKRLEEGSFYDETVDMREKRFINPPLLRNNTYIRNQAWLPTIEHMMEEKRNLFLVGAVHVNHLLWLLLHKKKYRITRLLDNGKEEVVSWENFNKPFA